MWEKLTFVEALNQPSIVTLVVPTYFNIIAKLQGVIVDPPSVESEKRQKGERSGDNVVNSFPGFEQTFTLCLRVLVGLVCVFELGVRVSRYLCGEYLFAVKTGGITSANQMER